MTISCTTHTPGEDSGQAESPATRWFLRGVGEDGTWDPRCTWAANDTTTCLDFDAGVTSDYEFLALDISETSPYGLGLHSVIHGGTSCDRSDLLGSTVLSLAKRFSPGKVSFILMDLADGSAFAGFEALPHVKAVESCDPDNSGTFTDLSALIREEMGSRQELFRTHGVRDIHEYREKSRDNSGMEQLPYLVIAADGAGGETSRIDREALFEMVATAGCALGVHLILTTQSRSSIPDVIDRKLSLSISMTDGMWIARTPEGPESSEFLAYNMHAPVALLAGEEVSVKDFLIDRISRVGKNCS